MVSLLGSFRAAITPFWLEAWLTAYIISSALRLTRLGSRLFPLIKISRLNLAGITLAS